MHTYRWIGAASLVLFLAACGSHQHDAPVPKDVPIPPGGPVVPAGPPVSPAGRPADQMDTGMLQPGTAVPADNSATAAQLLAARTAAYSRTMEPAVEKKAPSIASAPQPSATSQQAVAPQPLKPTQPTLQQANNSPGNSPPGNSSQVQWGAPGGARVAAVPDATPADPNQASLASMQSTPVANSSASEMPRSGESPASVRSSELASLTQPMRPQPQPAAGDAVITTQTESITQRLALRARDYPHDLSAQFDYELSRFITDQPVPDLTSLSALPSEDSEMIAALMDGLSNFRNNLRADGNMLMPQKVAPLLAAADRLKSRSGLNIPTMKLCTSVTGFGNYRPIAGDPPHFTAGQESRAILYCEVDNFSSQLMNDKQWRTQLAQNVVLYSDQGVPEWRDNRQVVSDVARSHRHDFFIVQKLNFSPNLAAGQYLLKVTVEDAQAGRFAEASIPINVDLPQQPQQQVQPLQPSAAQAN